jgi:hypothetical protein
MWKESAEQEETSKSRERGEKSKGGKDELKGSKTADKERREKKRETE